MRDELLDPEAATEVRGGRRGRPPAAPPRRVRRPGGAQGAPLDPPRGRPATGPGRRSPPLRRPARARQDLDGRDRRQRDGRADARHVGAGDRAGRRPRRPALEPRRGRRALRRRDPPPARARSRRCSTRRWRTSSSTSCSGKGPAARSIRLDLPALHAGRRHHPHRAHHRSAPRPLRPRRPPRLLRRRRSRGHRRPGRRDPRGRGRRRRGAGDRRPGPGHAAHRQPPAAPGARLRRGAGRRRRRRAGRRRRARASSASTSGASTRSTGPCSAPCASGSAADRSG